MAMLEKLRSIFRGAPVGKDRLIRDFMPDELTRPGPFRRHHPVFQAYEPFSGDVDPPYLADFVGAITDPDHSAMREERTDRAVRTRIPPPNEDYFEWIDALMAARDAGSRFTVVELGAGYGRWGVRAAKAAAARGVTGIRMIFAEAEPTHLAWLHEHVARNGFTPDQYEVIEAAISDEDSETAFYVGMPEDFDAETPRKWYGQAIAPAEHDLSDAQADADYRDRKVELLPNGWRFVRTAKRDVASIAGSWGVVDLLDIDIQGEELKVLTRMKDLLPTQIKRLRIGTHSPEIEAGIRSLMTDLDFECVRDFACIGERETPYGPVTFVDGAQTWLNRRFALTWG